MPNLKSFNAFVTELTEGKDETNNIQSNADNISKMKNVPQFYKDFNAEPEPTADADLDTFDESLPFDNQDVENDLRLDIATIKNNTSKPQTLQDIGIKI